MLRKSLVVGLLSAGSIALLACDEPVVGEWKTDDRINCDKKGEMTIESDLTGDGFIPLDCSLKCKFDVEATDSGADEWDIEIKIKTTELCTIDGSSKAEFECELEKDETELDCGNFYVWEIQED